MSRGQGRRGRWMESSQEISDGVTHSLQSHRVTKPPAASNKAPSGPPEAHLDG